MSWIRESEYTQSKFESYNYRRIAGSERSESQFDKDLNDQIRRAQVVVVGEYHYTRDVGYVPVLGRRSQYHGVRFPIIRWNESRVHVRELLQEHSQTGDILLREGHQRGIRYSARNAHKEFMINQGVKTFGWDNIMLVKLARVFRSVARWSHANNFSGTANRFDTHIARLSPKRERSLEKAIQWGIQHLTDGQKLFVVAGFAHVERNTELVNVLINSGLSYLILESTSYDGGEGYWRTGTSNSGPAGVP